MLFLQGYISVIVPFPLVSTANVVTGNFNKSAHDSKIEKADKHKINQKSPLIMSCTCFGQ